MTDLVPETASNSYDDGEFLGHPKGLYVCFATELWERFSFYGMKYLLLLYLTKYHLFADEDGLDVLGAYAGLVYALPVIGGLIADRYLGMRKSGLFGGILLSAGHLLMAVEGHQALFYAAGTTLADNLTLASGEVLLAGTVLSESITMQDTAALNVFYFALALIVMGVGYLKPNISTIVGKLYSRDDPRRDSGFTIFYMGINIGSFAATILCGWLGETYGWKYGFGAAGIGMVIGLLIFLRGQRHLHGHAEPPDPVLLRQPWAFGINRERGIYLGALAGLFCLWQLIQLTHWVHHSLNGLALVVVAGLLWFMLARCNPVERGRMAVLMVLTFASVVFWALFEQTAASMTLYADRVVDRTLLGVTVNASQFGALNPMFIMLLAPLFALLWTRLGRRQWEPSTPVKFALGIIQAGLGFGALVLGAQFPDSTGKVAALWLVLAYLLHTSGELCLSPVGLSAVTKLAVPRIVGLMMGSWFLALAYSELLAAQIAKLAHTDVLPGGTVDTGQALAGYTALFNDLLLVGCAAGLLLLLISPLLKRHMHGVR